MTGIPVMLVGNKCDEESGDRQITKTTGEALQVKKNFVYKMPATLHQNGITWF